MVHKQVEYYAAEHDHLFINNTSYYIYI